MNHETGWSFTAPWEPLSVRRGDALGFRPIADRYADLLAPGLSTATVDARWIALLSWCLRWSHVVWRRAERERDLSTRTAQRARYAWLRPLELPAFLAGLEGALHPQELRGRRTDGWWRRGLRRMENFATRLSDQAM